MYETYDIGGIRTILSDYQNMATGFDSFGQREISRQIEEAYLHESMCPTERKISPIVPLYNRLRQRIRRMHKRMDKGDSGLVQMLTIMR
jgi:hypothetical protein